MREKEQPLRKILALALNYLQLSLRSPIAVLMAFVMPILFTAALGAATGGAADEDTRTPVLVIDEDGGALARSIRQGMIHSTVVKPYQPREDERLPKNRAEALERLEEYERILILPTGLSDALLAGQPSSAQFYVADKNLRSRGAQEEINAVLAEVSGAVRTARLATDQAEQRSPFASNTERQAYFASALQKAQARAAEHTVTIQRELAVQPSSGEERLIANGMDQSSPGSLVNFGLVNLLSCAIVLVSDRLNGTLRRLLSSPTSKATLLAGKTLGPVLMGILQTLLLVGVGQLVFGVQWGRSPLALAAVALAFILAGVSLGILFSTLVRTNDQAVSIMIGASMSMAALGGAWWPMDIVPLAMQQFGHLFPSAWAMDGFQAVILRGAGLNEVLLPTAMLLGYALLFFVLGVWRFRFE
jgi:ABC-2 type transport system permease protein